MNYKQYTAIESDIAQAFSALMSSTLERDDYWHAIQDMADALGLCRKPCRRAEGYHYQAAAMLYDYKEQWSLLEGEDYRQKILNEYFELAQEINACSTCPMKVNAAAYRTEDCDDCRIENWDECAECGSLRCSTTDCRGSYCSCDEGCGL